jgi:predicted glycogen debranching enzyme
MVLFGPQLCGDLDAAATREWLVPDGVGGYAMGTVCGLRTRRYHGLLMVAERGNPGRRHLGLVALDPVLRLASGALVRLGVHEWEGGAVAPQGHLLLERFELVDGLPRWRWRVGDVVVERELAMAHGAAHVAVVHRLAAAPGPVTLTLEALTTWRDAHGERGAGGPPPSMAPTGDGVVIEGAYRIAGPGWRPVGQWYRGAYTRDEAARGLNPTEDLWFAGDFSAVLAPGEVMEMAAWAGDGAVGNTRGRRAGDERPGQVVGSARTRNATLARRAALHDEVGAALTLAADAFVVAGAQAPEVVAGYPWFGVWSRDTMTSYEGLFLATGRADEGRELLRGYAGTLSEGMLANTADSGQTEYNTVDATLWFLHAVERHVTGTGDEDLAAALAPAVEAVVSAHLAGTRYNIRVDADGLLAQGAPGTALTWMDARVDGVPVTPRWGKPVEVNALWVNGLAAAATLLEVAGRDAAAVSRLREKARAAFQARFPSPAGWLFDVVDGPGGDDPALRPNQLLAYSLPRGPLAGQPLPTAVGAALLTPLGPRSLAPGDPAYLGAHRGGPAERDRAYHQGTVWPWLVGAYVEASAAGPAPLAGIEAHLWEWGLGSVSETADGDAPHRATGCPFQAWSVAETLRVRQKAW